MQNRNQPQEFRLESWFLLY